MSEQWAIALTIFVLGQFISFSGGGLIAYLTLINKLSDAKVESEHRLTELETKCEKWFVLAGTAAMHRDDDKFGIDKDLERFVMLYRHHGYDLPSKEWNHYYEYFSKLAKDVTVIPNLRLCAEGLRDLCEHKLMRDGLLQLNKLNEKQ